MARVNGDIMIRSVLLQGAFTSFLFLGAAQGDVTLAANQVLLQFLEHRRLWRWTGLPLPLNRWSDRRSARAGPSGCAARSPLTTQWGVAGAALLSAAFCACGAGDHRIC